MSINDPIFFTVNDVERAIGLEELLNLHILCIDDSWLARKVKEGNNRLFILEESMGKNNPIFRNSNMLLKEPLAIEYIQKNRSKECSMIVFKVAPNIEISAKDLKLKLLNTTSQLNQRFENKIPQLQFLNRVEGVKIPKSAVGILGELDHDHLIKQFSEPYVIQFDRGHTGTGTIFVNHEGALEQLKVSFPKRPVRISQYIQGDVWTLNAVATSWGTHFGGLSLQITGIPSLTDKKGATVGNDWSRAMQLPESVISKISHITRKVGDAMYNEGFQGLFGLDLIVDDNGQVFLIEINARQPASTGIHTKLMLKMGQIPLQLLHIMEFTGVSGKQIPQYMELLSMDKLTEDTMVSFLQEQDHGLGRDISASQFIVRNSLDVDLTIDKDLLPGIYKFDNSSVNRKDDTPRYSIDKLNNDELLLLTANVGRNITPGTEFARVQQYGSVLSEKGELLKPLEALVSTLKEGVHEAY